MKVDFDISGWNKDQTYEKFDVVFFSGNAETGCNQFESGYYYATAANSSTTDTTLGPTGSNAKWTRSFPSTPSYNSSVSFNAKTFKNTFGDGYYTLIPKSHNNLEIQYSLNFNGRTEKESKAILHFLGHRFEEPYTGALSGVNGDGTEYQAENILTGFNFTPFSPYDQTGTYFCEEFDHQMTFKNVHDVTASFSSDETSLTNWKSQVIPLSATSGYWAEANTYSKFDVVYFSGHNVSNFSGFYYNSGKASGVAATTANGPTGTSSLWTRDTFYFKPSSFSIPQEPRFLKSDLNRDYVKRWNDGINTNLLNINLDFEGKSELEAKAISHFLINKKGYESFKFSPPNPYNQNDKVFVCQNWADNFIFSENRSLTARFEETPLDLDKVPRIFKTYILDTNGSIIAPYEKQDGLDKSVFNVNYGIFMTGFASGTGFYLMNSGDQKIISTLSLSGDHARSGVYKFKENSDSRFKVDGGNNAIFELDQKESGFFEIEFATTGKSGARDDWFTNDLDTDGYFYYLSGHGGAGYAGPWDRPSQLNITNTDQYLFSDPSGTLKIDLTGNAEALPPGPISTFVADRVEGDYYITGEWTYSEPLTATGIILEVSGIAPGDTTSVNATGVLLDEPTGTTTFSYPVVPGKTHYFRIRTQNIDLIGGNVNGGTLRKVEFSNWAYASGGITDTSLSVAVGLVSKDDYGLENVNLSGLAISELSRISAINSEITIDVFSKIKFNFAPNMLVYSAKNDEPAVDTGEKFTSTYGGGSSHVPIEIYIPKTTQIIGAGGQGADVMSDRTYSDGVKKECPIAMTVSPAQKDTLSKAHVKYCSLPELAGVGPIAKKYLDGKMDGSYVVGLMPNNGEDGGTALYIHPEYAGSSIKLDCRGFIGGGGGGGGAGGTRVSNITALTIFGASQKGWGSRTDNFLKAFEGNTFNMLPFYRSAGGADVFEYKGEGYSSRWLLGGNSTFPLPSLQNFLLSPSYAEEGDELFKGEHIGTVVAGTICYEARPGGGGGAGAGYKISTYEDDINVYTVTSPARGGRGCETFMSNKNVFGARTFFVNEPSRAGGRGPINFPFSSGTQAAALAGRGGLGAVPNFISPYGHPSTLPQSNYFVQDPSGLVVYRASLKECARNAGGYGGWGGGFGVDGWNGQHPVQNYTRRYISSQHGPEPRNFGFCGSGGLCIDTNNALIDFYPTDNIPCSGQDNKNIQDDKNSALYRNRVGKGQYLTPKYTSSTTVSASGHLPVGYISGLRSKADGKSIDYTDYNRVAAGADAQDIRKNLNDSNAISNTGDYPAWKGFNQRMNGDFDDYLLMDQGGAGVGAPKLPYYLIYDFGVGNEQRASAYTIASAGASASYYSDDTLTTIFGNVFAPVEWQLFGSNADSDSLTADYDMTLLHHKRHFSRFPSARIASPGQKVLNADYTDAPENQDDLVAAVGAEHNSYVCVPGNLRLFEIPDAGQASYRYYILKILAADGNQGKVKIADFGLRGGNESYAGFIKTDISNGE